MLRMEHTSNFKISLATINSKFWEISGQFFLQYCAPYPPYNIYVYIRENTAVAPAGLPAGRAGKLDIKTRTKPINCVIAILTWELFDI